MDRVAPELPAPGRRPDGAILHSQLEVLRIGQPTDYTARRGSPSPPCEAPDLRLAHLKRIMISTKEVTLLSEGKFRANDPHPNWPLSAGSWRHLDVKFVGPNSPFGLVINYKC